MVATLVILVWGVVAAVVAFRLGVGREPVTEWSPPRPAGSLRRLGVLSAAGLIGWMVLVAVAMSIAQALAPGYLPLSVAANALVSAAFGTGLLVLLPRPHPAPGGHTLPRGTLRGVAGLLLVLPWVYLTLAGTLAVLKWWGVEVEPTHQTLRTLAETTSPGLIVLLLMSTAIITPIFEEALFRGAIQGFCVAALTDPARPQTRWPRWGGIVIASLIFAGMHAPWSIPAIFVLGLGLGYLYERTGRLWPAIVMHALFNGIALTQTLLQK